MSTDPIRAAIAAHIKQIRPELSGEWERVIYLTDAGKFLDKHFPIEGGWGQVSIVVTPYILRENYPLGMKGAPKP